MLVVPTRRPRTVVTILAGLAVVAGFILLRAERVGSYVPEVVVSGEWGSGPGAFGRAIGPTGQVSGPRSFAVDHAGYIYVADTFNGSIKKYDHKGALLAEFQVEEYLGRKPLIDDLTVSADGHIFLADNAGGVVLKYSPQGRFEAALKVKPQLPEGAVWRLEGLAAGPGDGFYLFDWILDRDGYLGSVRLFTATGSLRSAAVEVRLDYCGRPLPEGSGVTAPIESFTPLDRDRLALLVPGSTPFQRWVHLMPAGRGGSKVLYESNTYMEEAALLGADASGRLYLGINLGSGRGWVIRLNGGGGRTQVFRTAPPEGEPGPASLVLGRVDAKGQIYLVRSTESRYEIIRVVPGHHLTLSPRWRPAIAPP